MSKPLEWFESIVWDGEKNTVMKQTKDGISFSFDDKNVPTEGTGSIYIEKEK